MAHSVTVPARVLQDLIFNAGLSAITMGPDMDAAVTEQTAILQACIDEQIGDSDAVYGRDRGTSPITVSFVEQPMAEIIDLSTCKGC